MSVPLDQSENIRMLIESSAAIVPRDGGLKRVRQLRFSELGFDPIIWQRMCDLGWISLRIPEAAGGAGLGLSALVALMIELGRGLVPEPLIQCGMAAALVDESALSELLAGKVILPAWQDNANSLATSGIQINSDRITGTKKFITYARSADSFLVVGRTSTAIVNANNPGVSLEVHNTQDGGHFGTLTLTNAPVINVRFQPDAISTALEEATLATAAYLLGLSERAFEMTVDYLKERRQFGRPIGSFQALQHRAVDLKIQLALTRASVESVARLIDESEAATSHTLAVSRAKIRASQTALLVTKQAVQMHGAIGYTDEYDLGLFLRKAMVLSHLFGSPAVHKARFGEQMMQPQPL